MKAQALGLIEVQGLVGAVTAADAAVKAAHVSLVGYEKAKGGGWTTVKLRGDVGAVRAAVEAGVLAAEKVCKVISVHVISRPHESTEVLAEFSDVAPEPQPASSDKPKKERKPHPAAEKPAATEASVAEVASETVVEAITIEEMPAETPAEPPAEALAAVSGETCNLCNDPACPRRKGQPYRLCIHWTGSEE